MLACPLSPKRVDHGTLQKTPGYQHLTRSSYSYLRQVFGTKAPRKANGIQRKAKLDF